MNQPQLQWGRNILVAESAIALIRSAVDHMLQWGRNILVAESRNPSHSRGRRTCFNGAATYSLRKAPPRRPDPRGAQAASMGPQHTRCGKPARRPSTDAWSRLQWGRNILVAESIWCEAATSSRGELQWGRNILVAESGEAQFTTYALDELQWGRNILVAESSDGFPWTAGGFNASMGPQHTRCGK